MKKIKPECLKAAARLKEIKSRLLSSEKGIALITTMLFTFILASLALVAVNWSTTDINRSDQYLKSRAAFYIAEAGIQRSLNFLNYDSDGKVPGDVGSGFTSVLKNFISSHSSDLTNVSYAGGTYNVTVSDNDDNDSDTAADVDNNIELTSTGTKGSSEVTLRAILHRPLYTAEHAITTEDDLAFKGNATTKGKKGSVHSNSDITGSSNAVEDGITAAGDCDSPCTKASAENLPSINPSDLKSYADFFLNDDGTVSDSAGTTLVQDDNNLSNLTYENSDEYTGWLAWSSNAEGLYYVEGDIKFVDANVPEDGSCKSGKVLICHLPPGNKDNKQQLCLPQPAVKAHLAHGDTEGKCDAESSSSSDEDKSKDKDKDKDKDSDGDYVFNQSSFSTSTNCSSSKVKRLTIEYDKKFVGTNNAPGPNVLVVGTDSNTCSITIDKITGGNKCGFKVGIKNKILAIETKAKGGANNCEMCIKVVVRRGVKIQGK